MNKTTAIFLVNDQVRCVSVAYKLEADPYSSTKSKALPQDIKSFKTMDQSIKVDDLVVVPTDTRLGFTTGKVIKTDLHVDFDSPETMRWIVDRIDTDRYKALSEQEELMMNRVSEADRETRRKKLADELFANVDPKALSGLALFAPNKPQTPPSGDEPNRRGGAQLPPEPDFL